MISITTHAIVVRGLPQDLLKQNLDEMLIKARALVAKIEAEVSCEDKENPIKVKGLPNSIDTNTPHHNYRDAMSREDRQELAAAYMDTEDRST